jgi:site-specific DNA recombinase
MAKFTKEMIEAATDADFDLRLVQPTAVSGRAVYGEAICQLITQPDYMLDALQRAGGGEWLPQHLQSRKQTLRKAHIAINQQLERLTEAYLMAIIPLQEYQRRRLELEQKGQALEAQTKEIEAQVDRQAELVQLGSSIEDFCYRIHAGLANATFDQKRAMVELLIDRVLVANGEVEIRYVVPTHPSSEKVRFCHLRKDYFHNIVPVPDKSAGAPTPQLPAFFKSVG